MKVLVLIVCISLAVLANGLTEEQRQKVKNIHQTCQSDPATHIDEDALKTAVRAGDVSNVANIGPHSLCMTKKMGIQKENGEVDKETLKTRISKVVSDETKVNQIVNDCGVQKANAEDTAKNLLRCFYQHAGSQQHQHS